ncbi:MAG: serine/threonine-protein kinase [Alphaproteobacteria bacterium]|nr:MAG: serine/threonine-protein kinase [Alphaproteobacteria bacterium]
MFFDFLYAAEVVHASSVPTTPRRPALGGKAINTPDYKRCESKALSLVGENQQHLHFDPESILALRAPAIDYATEISKLEKDHVDRMQEIVDEETLNIRTFYNQFVLGSVEILEKHSRQELKYMEELNYMALYRGYLITSACHLLDMLKPREGAGLHQGYKTISNQRDQEEKALHDRFNSEKRFLGKGGIFLKTSGPLRQLDGESVKIEFEEDFIVLKQGACQQKIEITAQSFFRVEHQDHHSAFACSCSIDGKVVLLFTSADLFSHFSYSISTFVNPSAKFSTDINATEDIEGLFSELDSSVYGLLKSRDYKVLREGRDGKEALYINTSKDTIEKLFYVTSGGIPEIISHLKMAKHSHSLKGQFIFDGLRGLLVMPKCDSDLYNYMLQRKQLSEATMVRWIKQLASVLNYLHSNQVLHRDIKLDNIFMKGEDVFLADYGFANAENEGFHNLRRRCGTPAYLPPEILSAELYGPAIDIYSLGIVFYAMQFLGFPFKTDMKQSDWMGLATEARRTFNMSTQIQNLAVGSTSRRIAEFTARMLQFHPQDRPTAQQLDDFAKTL